ncbi:hypothetical protein EW145_g5831 [Phellinidium pouzarii]|uniref:Uncharacterized protein n=1 Tax=Phellinidium pouzarii TaxID=167371 RepID=A0A4S4KYV1_9AGAM|nr:hypothetical protein EW145_g5831 [Phellinidium pouzarii]
MPKRKRAVYRSIRNLKQYAKRKSEAGSIPQSVLAARAHMAKTFAEISRPTWGELMPADSEQVPVSRHSQTRDVLMATTVPPSHLQGHAQLSGPSGLKSNTSAPRVDE